MANPQKDSPRKAFGEAGAVPILILVAIIGVIAAYSIFYLAPFKNNLLSSVFPKQFSFAAGPAISNISDNRATFPNSQIPKYEKYEVTFSLTTAAQNPQLPYDPSPPTGIQPGIGVTVNAEFSQDNFATKFTQPAFYYQDFDYQQTASWDWFYPKNNFSWKVRFSPPKEGNWQYRLTALDSGGTSTSGIQSFTVTPSGNKGFIRVSQKDPRYFEYEDGTYFPALGYNLPFNRISWTNPVLDNQANFQKMNQNGIQLIRHWLSDWGIFSSFGTPWATMLGGINDPGLSSPYDDNSGTANALPKFGGSDVSWELVKYYNPCIFSGWKQGNAFKPNTKYKVFIRYLLPQNMPAAVDPTKPRGLVVKSGPWFDGAGCSNPNNGTPVTTHVNQVSPKDGSGNFQWQVSEGSFTTGIFDGEPYDLRTFYLALDNIDNTTNIDPNPGEVAVVDRIEIREDLGNNQCAKAGGAGALLDLSNGQCGANVMAKPGADALKYMDQRYSAAFDKVLDLAKQNNVYLKLVVLEKNEYIQNHVDYSGDGIIDWRPNCLQPSGKNVCPGNEWFYGNWGAPTKVYWEQQAWWRYLQARWGYSTNIHSFELMNEGDPFNSQHYTQAENFAQYMHQFKPNDHLVTTSNWSDLPHPFWKDPAYSSLDFADMHLYIPKDDAWNFRVDKDFAGQVLNPYNNQDWYDSTSAVTKLSNLIGAKQQYGVGKPTIRGETGFVVGNSDGWQNDIQRDSKGIWVHNYVWAGINSGGLIESYWYATDHIYPSFDNRGKFGDYYNFINNIPLSNGNYVDSTATATDTNLTVLGQKDPVNKRAHLWVQNKKHIWCAVLGGVSGCPNAWDNSRLNGTVTLSGFTANTSYPVEWWQFDNNVTLTKTTSSVTSNASGQLVLSLASLPATTTDVGIKIGDYTTTSASPSPQASPTPSKPGDIDGNGKVDIFDYNILLTNFGKTGSGIQGDLDGNNKVDIFDYNILLTNFGK